jgi:hypothetical protein
LYNFIEYYRVHYSSITDNGRPLYVTIRRELRIGIGKLDNFIFDSSYGISKFKLPRHFFSERQFVFFILWTFLARATAVIVLVVVAQVRSSILHRVRRHGPAACRSVGTSFA